MKYTHVNKRVKVFYDDFSSFVQRLGMCQVVPGRYFYVIHLDFSKLDFDLF